MAWTSGTPANHLRKITLRAWLMLAAFLAAGVLPASAENAFLLQIGTSDTEELATQKWEDVKSKNADIVGGLSLHVAEVALPPSNTASYRTQVGPVSSRTQATSLCGTLQSRGVECYVVETAMFGGNASAASTAETLPSAPLHAQASAATKHAAPAQEDMSHLDDPDYIPPPMDSGPVIVSTSTGAAPAPYSASEVAELPVTPAAAPVAVSSPAPVTHVAQAEEETPAPVARKTVLHAPVETASSETSTGTHYINGRGPRFLDGPSETRVASSAPVASAPIETLAPAKPKESPGFFGRLFGSTPESPPTTSEGVVGSVNVAEAVRVPLSSENAPPKQKIVPVLPQVHPLGGLPSQSDDKTLWAQVSYFRDEAQALTFYRQFTSAYPQLSDGLRIRITRPFDVHAVAAKVSLRVGPFAGMDDVRTICGVAARWKARCTVVRDIGASSPLTPAPAHTDKPLHADPAQRSEAHGQYWALLGTYHSSQDAWDAWTELKATHRKLTRNLHPTVSTPPAGSTIRGVYRLRTGPYDSESRVSELCNRLQAVSADCLVVNDR